MSPVRAMADAPVILIPQYFGCIVFERSLSRYLPFDAETTELLKRSQNTPFWTLIEEIPAQEKREQALSFFKYFYEQGFFTLDGRFAGVILNVQPAADHLTGPLAVHLEVSAACNLSCIHCFAGELPRQEKPLSLAELELVFASMAHMGSFRLGLTGGEPLLRRDLFEIIDLALSYGLHPCITTNGTLITEDIAQEFGKRRLVWLNVSLDGATAATNDHIRGAGTFDRVMANLARLAKHSPFTLAFTVMRTNASEVKACAELAYRIGASTAVFRPLYPVGKAQPDLMPSFAQYNEALTELSEMANGGIHTIEPFSPYRRADTRANTSGNYGCGAGNLVCSISVSGDVNPCSFLGSSFADGNVREQSLENIWHNSDIFRTMRALSGGTENTFSGGCRARSLALNGAINAPDPWMSFCADEFYDPLTILELSRLGESNGR